MNDDILASDTLIFLDFEASALHGGYPVEIGWAVLAPDGTITVESHMIRPTDAWLETLAWDPAAEEIHGIPLRDLMDAGRPVDEAARRTAQVMNDVEKVYTKEGVRFDAGWLEQLFRAADLPAPGVPLYTVDTLITLAGEIDQNAYMRAFDVLADPRHRAGPDAWAEAEFVRRYREAAWPPHAPDFPEREQPAMQDRESLDREDDV